MQVKIILRRYPLKNIYFYDGIVSPFTFQPKLFEYIPPDKAKGVYDIIENLDEMKQIRRVYEEIRQKYNIDFIEFNEQEIEINDEVLEKIISYSKQNEIKLRPYAELLPILTEEKFNELRQKAKKHGYKNVIPETLK